MGGEHEKLEEVSNSIKNTIKYKTWIQVAALALIVLLQSLTYFSKPDTALYALLTVILLTLLILYIRYMDGKTDAKIFDLEKKIDNIKNKCFCQRWRLIIIT